MFVTRNKGGEEKGTKRFQVEGRLPDDMRFELRIAEIGMEEFRGRNRDRTRLAGSNKPV